MDYKDIILIKKMIANGVISQEVAEKYIPELKESEDEFGAEGESTDILADAVLGDNNDGLIAGTIRYKKQTEQKNKNPMLSDFFKAEYERGKTDAQNSAWSEEDETKIKSIIAFLKSPAMCAMDGNKDIIDENIKYLKSLKDRYTWKPSDEQMQELHNVFNDTSAGWEDSVIESLYNDLKKLREE